MTQYLLTLDDIGRLNIEN